MQVDRAQGWLLGQLAEDALGSLLELQSLEQIRLDYPGDVRELVDGGTWNTIAGQPTDDSEMALLLARMLAEGGTYDGDAAQRGHSPGKCVRRYASESVRGRAGYRPRGNAA